MTRISTVIDSLVVIGASLPVCTSLVTYGQQLCVMLKSGISKDKAWAYITQEHTKATMANTQTVMPWYSADSAGWAVGTALGNTERAQKELTAMKSDVFIVARTNCPEQFRQL